MAVWSTAFELSKRFVVGEPLLLSYGKRGNLPMRRLTSGETLFDEDVVMRLFRPRASGEWPIVTQPRTNLAVLGSSCLGASPQSTRKRPVRELEVEASPIRRRAAG